MQSAMADGQFEVGPPALAVQQLDLHGAPERLHRGVVVAVADGAHRADSARRRRTFSVNAQDGELAGLNRSKQHRLVGATVGAR